MRIYFSSAALFSFFSPPRVKPPDAAADAITQAQALARLLFMDHASAERRWSRKVHHTWPPGASSLERTAPAAVATIILLSFVLLNYSAPMHIIDWDRSRSRFLYTITRIFLTILKIFLSHHISIDSIWQIYMNECWWKVYFFGAEDKTRTKNSIDLKLNKYK